jgi:hypothetical protein
MISSSLPAWLVALGFAAAMLSLGVNMGLLAKPNLTTRCGACRRIVRRGQVCPCSRPHRDD